MSELISNRLDHHWGLRPKRVVQLAYMEHTCQHATFYPFGRIGRINYESVSVGFHVDKYFVLYRLGDTPTRSARQPRLSIRLRSSVYGLRISQYISQRFSNRLTPRIRSYQYEFIFDILLWKNGK